MMAKKKGFEQVGDWKRSINNHVYWCASSTTDNEEDLREAKWRSLTNHMQNQNVGHSELFSSCLHGPLGRRKKKWLKSGTEATVKLRELLEKTSLVKDVRKMSTTSQTSAVEAFHSLLNQYAPKSKAYSNPGILNRLRIAALHYNDNSDRPRAVTSDGFPKYKKGEATVKPVKDTVQYGYVNSLFVEVVRRCRWTVLPPADATPAPPTLSSKFAFPDKNLLIAQHKCRFSKAQLFTDNTTI